MKYKNFEDLPVWILAREIVNLIYGLVKKNLELDRDLRLKVSWLEQDFRL